MTRINVDDSLKQKLGGFDAPVEFCAPDGRVLGRYLPEDEYKKMLYASVEIPFSEEELAKFRSERGGCTLDEIWKRLGRK